MNVPVFMYGSETMIWKEKERSRIRAEQMGNLRSFLDIGRMDRIPNRIRELCKVMKAVVKSIVGVFWWFGHVERISKKVHVGESLGSCSEWVDYRKDRLIPWRTVQEKKICMLGKQGEWWKFVWWNAWGVAQGITPDLDEILQLWVAIVIWSTRGVEFLSEGKPTT